MKRTWLKQQLASLVLLALLLTVFPAVVWAESDFSALVGDKNCLKTTGESFSLEVFPKNGTEPYSYSWEYTSYKGSDWTAFSDTEVYSGSQKKILSFTGAPAGTQMKVHCVVTDAAGMKAVSDDCFVTVKDSYDAPEIYYIGVQGAGPLAENVYSAYKGAVISLYCNAATTGDVILYQWQYSDGTTKTVNVLGGGTKETKIWTNIAGANGHSMADIPEPLRAGEDVKAIRCRLTDNNGTVTSEEIAIQTIGTVRRVSDPEDCTVSVGETALFKAAFEGAVEYKWAYIPAGGDKASYINSSFAAQYGVTILGETGDTLTISGIQDTALDGCRFYCCGYDSAGAIVTTKTATLSVIEKQQNSPSVPVSGLPFTDISSSAWYLNDVKNAYLSGLISGKTETEYCPEENMSVAEAIKLASCMHQLYHDGKVTLTTGTPWYQTYVDYAEEKGIINKTYSDYNRSITREEYVHIFFHALPQKEYVQFNMVNYGDIPDVESDHRYALEIYTFYRAGILTGTDAYGSFEPESYIKRSEVAAILTRMMKDTARVSVVLKKK